MAVFSVHASWLSGSDVPDDAALKINETLRPDDDDLCAWVDEAEPRRFLVSFDVETTDYTAAARECLIQVAVVLQIEPRLGALEGVGATDEEGYLVVSADDLDALRHRMG